MTRLWVRAAAAALAAASCSLLWAQLALERAAQGPTTATASASAAASRKAIRLDAARRQVVIQAEVVRRSGPLEFVLCQGLGKAHESILSTAVPPSQLHAAMLMLGLSAGKPAHWITAKEKQPIFMPPAGAAVEVELRWKDAEGKVHESPATDWLLSSATSQPAPKTRWIFVGSDILEDGQYWADIEGERHHICLVNFASSVIDVPFKSSDKSALLEFTANTDLIPPLQTAVEVVVTAVKGAETAPVARAGLSIDNLGRVEWEGQPIAPDKIPEAAKKFLSRHPQGIADVKVDARAMVWDRERLKSLLEEAGVTEVNFRLAGLSQIVLPRTAAEASSALAQWKDRFAHARDYIIDPAEDVALSIQAAQARTKEIQQLAALWADYAAQLRELIRAYGPRDSSSTQPSVEK